MTTLSFHRPARTLPPTVPEDTVTLAAPPQKPSDNQAQTWLYMLIPLLSSVSMAAYMATFGKPWMILLGVSFVVVSVGVTVYVRSQSGRANRRAQYRQRARYAEYLTEVRARARQSAAAQRSVSAFQHPSPRRLYAISTGLRRVWERRPDDPDFLTVRLGQGRGAPALRLAMNRRSDPIAEFETESYRAAEKLARDYATVGLQPACVDLSACGVLSLLGPKRLTAELASALLLQIGVLHAPDDVRIVALTSSEDTSWSWVKWLPHAQEPGSAGRTPLIASSFDGIADVLQHHLDRAQSEMNEQRGAGFTGARRDTARHHVVVVLEDFHPGAAWAKEQLITDLLAMAGPFSGLHAVCLVTKESEEPGRVDARARLDADGRLKLESPSPALVGDVSDAVADACASRLAEQTAKALTPLRLSGEQEQVLSRTVALPEMLGIGDLASYEPSEVWRAPDDDALLRLPIGVTGAGQPLVLDLKESALGGVGPHGLIVGATGSGKSELLRTLVTGLTMTHAPDQLSFVLVDFKGGATFAGVTELPHVAGLITNLADDLALVDRMRAALQGEQQRRQQMLRDAGNIDSVREYQILHAQGATDVDGHPLEPMPYLMVVVDEFGELLSQRPDFIELFVQIGRVGRSLGMHLLLATQRLEEGRLRGLDSHLSYRICLRTFSAAESRAVIGTPDAYRLPSIPGSAYLKVDESVYERFRVAHVSGAYRRPGASDPAAAGAAEPLPFVLRTRDDARADSIEETEIQVHLDRPKPGERTEMQVAVERVRAHGSPVHQVWLPPLPAAIELESLVGPLSVDPDRGYRSDMWQSGGRLVFPIGVVDVPARQQQRALLVDFSGMHGHLMVVGAPQTGKSTFLRTALLSAMVTHTPEELQFVVVDFGGGSLLGIESAPHVSGVATRHDDARMRRALTVMRQLIEERERLFQQHRIDNATTFRQMRDAGELPPGTNGADVVLVIDNWAAVRSAFERADDLVADVASRGLGVGVHLLITANRWTEIRTSLRDNITGRLELRLNEPAESEISRPAAKQLAGAVPGRGVVAPGLHFHTVLPRLDGVADTADLTRAQATAVADLVAAWTGPPAPELRVLSETVTPDELFAVCETAFAQAGEELPASAVPVGLRESDLAPAVLDLAADGPHFLVYGDSGSGKSTFLRSWMSGLAARNSAWDVRFMVIDYRRNLLQAVPGEYLAAQAGDAVTAAAYVEQLAGKLQERLPPPDITPRRLRERDWWSGPELFLVVDDHDLVSAGRGGPLAPVADYLAQAGDIGFHLVLARRHGGMRSMSDSLLTRLHELGSSGLLLSGDPREGLILGDTRAARRAPGRGTLVSRRFGNAVVQTVLPPDPDVAEDEDPAETALGVL